MLFFEFFEQGRREIKPLPAPKLTFKTMQLDWVSFLGICISTIWNSIKLEYRQQQQKHTKWREPALRHV